MKLTFWPFGAKRETEQNPEKVDNRRTGLWTTDLVDTGIHQRPFMVPDFQMPEATASMAMDSVIGQPNAPKMGMRAGVPDALMEWYASQSFIGYAASAIMAQHWLIDKACRMPARDAVRQGYNLDMGDDDLAKKLRKADARFGVNPQLVDLVASGRIYGIRCVLFRVLSTDPCYYEKPFNIDGVNPGCYMGMRQIDPQWMTAELTDLNVCDPASPEFMQPAFWRIGNKRYHRSHLHFFVPHAVTDLLKPTYRYGGVSVPQRVYERVYAAERTANEAPQLAMTKRLNTLGLGEGADFAKASAAMEQFSLIRNNYGVMLHGEGETIGQMDTSLADFDALLMTQYQLVAAEANVPGTKLLGTTPKGFNATGEYEESVYREELESIQTNDLSPMLERHYKLQARNMGIKPECVEIQWQPLDSPTAQEFATIQKTKAETDKLYFDMQAIDGVDVRERIRNDKEGDYFGLAEAEDEFDLSAEPVEPVITPVDPVTQQPGLTNAPDPNNP